MTDAEMTDLIATRVMGWHRRPNAWRRLWYSADGGLQIEEDYWHPTTNAAQAVQALEAMRDRGYDVRLGSVGLGNIVTAGEWWAWLSRYDEGVSFYDASLPRAICLALVEAVR
jgi:hypothetical protein